jgi:dihydroorotase (multifunctional complex type)
MAAGPDLAVVGGIVVTADGARRADILVRAGTIVANGLEGASSAARVMQADGLYVLPGMVDSHVHLMDPGPTEREDFPTGTAAAAAGGITTVIEHTHAHPVRSAEELREKARYLRGRSRVDFGLAAHVWPDRIDQVAATWRAGVTFFKVFTCTTHGVPGLGGVELQRAFEAVADAGGVCLVHAEDEEMTAAAEATLRAAGRTDGRVIPEWRSREAEAAAVTMVVDLALRTRVRAGVAHVSSPAVAELVASGRARGAELAAEACPQYLLLREDEVDHEGALRKFTPPARIRDDTDEAAMWGLLRGGVLTHVATDHAPSTRKQKLAGDVWDAPFGLPGLDTTLALLLDAVARQRIGWSDLVLRYSEAPARWYGLFPRKGGLQVGADADLVLVDPGAEREIRDRDVISKAGWTPYAGRRVRGRVVATLLRGREVARDGRTHDRFDGEFLPGPGARGPV